jgi:hypothetical protein
MLDFRDDYMEMTRREIHKAANNFRQEERPNWKRVEPWPVCFLSDKHGSHKWCIDFFDDEGHWRGVSFEDPLQANDQWYKKEIARQLRDN